MENKIMTEKTDISFFRSLKGKLILFFVLVGLIPALIVGVISYTTASGSMKTQAFNSLEAVQTIKAQQISNYFEEREGDMGVLMETVGTLRKEAFDKLTRLAVVLDQIIEEFQMDAIALRCWIEMQQQLGISPCVLLGLLNDRGIAAACEVARLV